MYIPIDKSFIIPERLTSASQPKDLIALNEDFVPRTINLPGSLTEEDKEKYAREGLLVIKGIGQPVLGAAIAACDELDNQVRGITHSFGDFNLEAASGGWASQDGITECYPGAIRRVKNLIDYSDTFLAVASDPTILAAVKSLLLSKFILHSKGFLMNKPPRIAGEKDWHQDSAYFPADSAIITAWVPLQDVDEQNGCMYAIPGSHLFGPIEHIGTERHLENVNLTKSVVCPMKAGDILLMDKHTFHYTGHNDTDRPRRALLFRYMQSE